MASNKRCKTARPKQTSKAEKKNLEREKRKVTLTNYETFFNAVVRAGMSDGGLMVSVIQTAAYLDGHLWTLLESKIPNATMVDVGSLSFSAKIRWSRALDFIDERMYKSIETYRAIRNDYSHDLAATLNQQKAEELLGALSGRAKEIYEWKMSMSSDGLEMSIFNAGIALKVALEEVAHPGQLYTLDEL